MDAERFNRLSSREQAEQIIRAAAKARNLPAPKPGEPIKIEDGNPESMAVAICLAGRRARGQQE